MELSKEAVDLVIQVLQPFAAVADAYERSELDKARPEWADAMPPASEIELFTGRGGKRLITLQDCFNARGVLAALNLPG